MKNSKQILLGILITIDIYIISQFLATIINLKNVFIPGSFIVHTTMLFLSIFVIFLFRNQLDFKLKIPEFKKILITFLVGFFVSFFLNIIVIIISKMLGLKLEGHPATNTFNPLQIFIFVVIYASIAEELLFRGFLLNFLNNHIKQTISIFKWNIKLTVLISGVMFGLGHLIVAKYNVGINFLISIVLISTIGGIFIGIYQEKYKNTSYAIIFHMGVNFVSFIGALLMSNVK